MFVVEDLRICDAFAFFFARQGFFRERRTLNAQSEHVPCVVETLIKKPMALRVLPSPRSLSNEDYCFA